MKKHFVTFLSPGTFFNEETTREISQWDEKEACQMAHDIVERHNATPFAFYFSTRTRGENDLDSRVTAKSDRFFLGGEVKTLEQVKAENNPEWETLIVNMEVNKWDRVVFNYNSYRSVQPLMGGDVVLAWAPKTKQPS